MQGKDWTKQDQDVEEAFALFMGQLESENSQPLLRGSDDTDRWDGCEPLEDAALRSFGHRLLNSGVTDLFCAQFATTTACGNCPHNFVVFQTFLQLAFHVSKQTLIENLNDNFASSMYGEDNSYKCAACQHNSPTATRCMKIMRLPRFYFPQNAVMILRLNREVKIQSMIRGHRRIDSAELRQ